MLPPHRSPSDDPVAQGLVGNNPERDALPSAAVSLADALQDPLTGLGNRRHFHQALEVALRKQDGLSLLMINLDRFKQINDTLGHPSGDALLSLVGKRIRHTMRETETVFRLGGDEFAVLLQDGENAETLAARVVEVLGRPFLVNGQIANIGASIGIAAADPAADNASSLIRHANLALHHAKGAGGGRLNVFEPPMAQRADERRTLELDLRKALKLGEFQLVYQPQLNIQTNALTGAEALLRWHHPTRGLISPDAFIPVAEDMGAIVAIGEWVLRTACRDAAAWPGSPTVAVNVSPLQFDQGDRLFAAVDRALTESGLPPDRLVIEITESSLMRKDSGIVDVLHRMRALGVRIAMDDFGTGYSSLGQLMAFPFDKIKIDQSFIRGSAACTGGAAVVRTIAALGASLGMSTIAEGVETEAQAALVESDGCTDIQGYHVSRPVSAEAIMNMLTSVQTS